MKVTPAARLGRSVAALALALSALAACTDEAGSGTLADAALGDAAAHLDAEPTRDAAPTGDAEPALDAAPNVDATTLDAAPNLDASPAPDAAPAADSGIADAGAPVDAGPAACDAIGQACTTSCPSPYFCQNGACVPEQRATCGGFVGAACPAAYPDCLFFAGADYGPCFTSAEHACVCAHPNAHAVFPACP